MMLLIGLLILWCAIHSLLITTIVQRHICALGTRWQAWYRLSYVLFSGLSLIPLFWYSQSLPRHTLLVPGALIWALQGPLFLYALVMFFGGAQAYDLEYFLGIRQWREDRDPPSSSTPSFTCKGMLRYVRHPWYSGGIALLCAWPEFSDVSLIIRSLFITYLIIGAFIEEHRLKKNLGRVYQQYCREVPMFIPWRRRRPSPFHPSNEQ